LKTSNIFISQDGNIKVGDYAIYKILKLSNIKSKNGTSFYLPPEFWNNQENNDKVDSWGLGCILYELCKLDYPFNDDNIFAHRENIYKSYYPPIPCNFSKNMNKAIKQLLEVDQNKRLSLKDFIIQDYVVEISEKVGLLSELHELYPSIIKNKSNNTIDTVYKNILRRNEILNESFFDFKFNKESDSWKKAEQKRSLYNLDYYPPTGWIGIGLNINKFSTKKDWIDKDNGWATAYHGLRLCETKDKNYINFNCNEYDFNMKLDLTIKSIIENGLRDGINQPFKYENNSFPFSNDEYKLCGEGVYLSFQIEEAEKYTMPISGYKFVLMCKVCPTKIRESGRFKGEFVADGNYIRPYRILAKMNNNNN
jgi:serine/threonine protein kinase